MQSLARGPNSNIARVRPGRQERSPAHNRSHAEVRGPVSCRPSQSWLAGLGLPPLQRQGMLSSSRTLWVEVRNGELEARTRCRALASAPAGRSTFGGTAAEVGIAADAWEIAHIASGRIARARVSVLLRLEIPVRLNCAAGINLHECAPGTDRQPQPIGRVILAGIGTE